MEYELEVNEKVMAAYYAHPKKAPAGCSAFKGKWYPAKVPCLQEPLPLCHCATVPLCHCAPAKVLAITEDKATATVMYMEEGNPVEVGVVLTSIKVKK